MSSTDGATWMVKIDGKHILKTLFDTKDQAVKFAASHAANAGGNHTYDIWQAPAVPVPPVRERIGEPAPRKRNRSSYADILVAKSREARERKRSGFATEVEAFWQQFSKLAEEATMDGYDQCTVEWRGNDSGECIDAIDTRLRAEKLSPHWIDRDMLFRPTGALTCVVSWPKLE